MPAGSFTMGSPQNEQGRKNTEGPQRLVSIRRFAVGKFDVTRGQWAAFASATKRVAVGGCVWDPSNYKFDPKISWRKLGFGQNDEHPVVCVTWQDAQDYVHWLGQRTDHAYRLLSEAEWEYAARGGTTTAYPGDRLRLMNMPTTAPTNAARDSHLDATVGCRRHPSAHFPRMRSVFTTCTAMSCNGYRIVSQLLIQDYLQMVPLTKRRFS